MLPSLCSRSTLLTLALVALVAPLAALEVQSVEVTAPQSWVLTGRTMQLTARALLDFGQTATDVALSWRSSNTAAAVVDANGRVAGVAPGRAEIFAAAGSVAGRVTVWVHPSRVDIVPGRLDLELGQQAGLSARAVDADARNITGFEVSWVSALPGVATVDSNGLVRAVSAGTTTIAVRLNTRDYSIAFSAQATVTVRPRREYRVERLAGNDTIARAPTLRWINSVSYAGDRVGFIGYLSNGSQAAMLYDAGNLRTLVMNGEWLPARSQAVEALNSISVNDRGDAVVRVVLPNYPNPALLRYRAGVSTPEVLSVSDTCCINMSTRALGNNGDVLFSAWTSNGWETRLIRADGRVTIVTAGQLDGFGRVDWTDDPILLPSGAAVVRVNQPGRWALYFWNGAALQKLYDSSGQFLGQQVNWVGTPMEGAAGDIYLYVNAPNNNRVMRYAGGTWSTVVDTSALGVCGGCLHNLWGVSGNTLWIEVNTGPAVKLFRRTGSTQEEVLAYGGEWSNLQQFIVNTQGAMVLFGQRSGAPFSLSRVQDGRTTSLVEMGRPFASDASASLSWRDLAGGVASGAPVVSTTSRAIVRVVPGGVEPLFNYGDRMPGGEVLTWINDRRATDRGVVAVMADTTRGRGLYLYRDGVIRLIYGAGLPIAIPNTNWVWFWNRGDRGIGVNNRGQIVAYADSDRGRGLLLVTDAATPPQWVVRVGDNAAGEGSIQDIGETHIDDAGRILFGANIAGAGDALFLWERGQLRKVLHVGRPGPRGGEVNGFNNLRAAGERFFVEISLRNAPNEVAAYEQSSWRYPPQPSGGWFNNSYTPSSAAPLVEAAYLTTIAGNTAVAVRRRDGQEIMVARTGERLASGEWLLNVYDVMLGADGDVYFTGLTLGAEQDRISLFRARPL